VEHAVSFDEVRPWRTAAIVASGVAALELLALIVAGAFLIGRPFAERSAKTAPQPAAKQATAKQAPKRAAILSRGRTRVVVLNGNGETGAAATEADAIHARGYRISAVGNASEPAEGPTIVMYRPGYVAEAKRLAHDAGINIVTAVEGLNPRSLHRAQLVILVGNS
jgi:hypothetical protein